jgi:hypothetical protein
LRCSQCGQSAAGDGEPANATSLENQSLERLLRDSAADDWALEAELRGVQRLIGSLQGSSPPAMPAGASAVHAAHVAPAAWHVATPADPRASVPLPAPPKTNALAWLSLAVGLAIFACGAVLLGWSLAADREDLWTIGLPLALVGQAGLILGLILQLDGLSHTNRQTAAALSELDGELSRVRQATTLLTATKSSSAQSFYAHLAAGASPQLLLADLKGQLDLLAQQMAAQR